MSKYIAASILFLAFFIFQADAGDWRAHLSACAQDAASGGSVAPAACQPRFVGLGAVNCIAVGGRACLIDHARGAASAGDCQLAFEMAAACQCNNPGAESDIRLAGVAAVCRWLVQSSDAGVTAP